LNIYAFSSLSAFIICASLGFFVYSRSKRNILNQTFALTSLLIGIWCLFSYLANIAPNEREALLYARLIYIAAFFTPSAFFHFVFVAIGINKRRFERSIIRIFYFVSVLFLSLAFNPHFIKGVVRRTPHSAVVPGNLYPLFILFFGILFPYAIYQIFINYRNATGYRKNQLKYLFLGFFAALGGGILHLTAAYTGREPVPHDTLLIIWAIMITFAIVKYRLMDINIVITQTGIFILVYTLILGLPFILTLSFKDWLIKTFASNWWLAPFILMAGLAALGPFIYIYVQRKAKEKLLREQSRYQDTLKQASVGMTRIRNLRKLLDLITHIVTKSVRISYAAIYLYNPHTQEYVLQVSRDKGRIPVPKLSSDNTLIAWITVKREPLVYEEVKQKMIDEKNATYKHLEYSMRLLTASVIIPSFLEDRFMGFFVLGDKTSGQIYTREDLNVFEVLASQAALAIENAQFYEETKEMQEQIAQAEKMATIGTMADGLSHQINNRFYALSLIADDTIDSIKTTDTTKCTPEVQEMIKNINHALNRIQTNVMQGGEVVKGILKYTRKGEGDFEQLSLDRILDNTLEMVQYKIKLPEIDIVREYSKDTPKINGNIVQLQEVFFNLIDNAYDSIIDRRNILKEEGYRGKIRILARPKNYSLEIEVRDNGMGIRNTDMEKIFTPFFTTKSTSRKGTGLGLYVIRRIITDTHKGKISFESEYKTGAAFTIELPYKK